MKIPRRKFEAEVPSTAMGDIAFLLLIFFVILARAVDDSHLQWKPAEAEDVKSSGAAVASVTIDSNRKLYLNGQSITADALPGALETLLGEASPGSRKVFLKVDRDATAAEFEPAISAVSAAGGELIHVLNEEPPKTEKQP